MQECIGSSSPEADVSSDSLDGLINTLLKLLLGAVIAYARIKSCFDLCFSGSSSSQELSLTKKLFLLLPLQQL